MLHAITLQIDRLDIPAGNRQIVLIFQFHSYCELVLEQLLL